VELRRLLPKTLPENVEIVIYASSPVQSIVGKATVKRIEINSPKTLWHKLGHKTGVSFEYFQEYFQGKNEAYGIVFESVEEFEKPYPLSWLRKKLNFYPPQSYMYARDDLMDHIG